MDKLMRFLSYVLVAALASCLTVYACLSTVEPESKLDQLQRYIMTLYIEEADETALEDAAASAMVAATGDRWSYYVSAADYAALMEQKNNAYVGIGITISVREDGTGLDIIQVAANGPAAEAGVRAGDILVKAEGQNVAELGLDGTRPIVQGEEGTSVTITVLRDGQEMDFTVERRTIETIIVTSHLMEDIGYIRIANFNARSAQETIAAAKELQEQGAKALIFDVRFNGGGYKDEMVEVLDYLLPEGPLFRSEHYTGEITVDESDASCIELPMAVLVNGSSYSAAEFFAAALREYDAAVVVGQQTTGKGHYQMTYRLNDGSALNISVGRYTTPNGVNLDGVGITPDVVVKVDDETASLIYAEALEPENDPQIQAAVEAVRKKMP